jgi:hypothetical protein
MQPVPAASSKRKSLTKSTAKKTTSAPPRTAQPPILPYKKPTVAPTPDAPLSAKSTTSTS